ncbi:hypothetical protein ACFRAQ_36025 [Nocardia sp. NPDC056611]|uniref:hypothetical protein n=1 Tax=Nocardia sp. NPDC056611 TaxID=3345877 RepID=UPI00366C5737
MTAANLPDLPDPVCGSLVHEFGPIGPAPTAAYWANWHGCADNFVCAPCLQIVQEQFARKVENGTITCSQCRREFTAFNDFVKWQEL